MQCSPCLGIVRFAGVGRDITSVMTRILHMEDDDYEAMRPPRHHFELELEGQQRSVAVVGCRTF